ncbi:MAG: ATP-binding protein [Bacillota bacterium]|nr:ATP-binding protein [Bacillota bacterium]
MRETRNLEFKQEITNSFLKTVSAYANYGTGKILFGVLDNGKECGITNPTKACLDIENKINDSIDPVPSYTLSINEISSVITLQVEEGIHKPYFYKSKAYVRNDSATIEVDRVELKRLILEGENISYEEVKSEKQDLSFNVLERVLRERIGIDCFSIDTLKTLELYDNQNGYNIAGQLFADENDYPGIDVVRFGENISVILDRETFLNESILVQYEKVIDLFDKYYSYEEIKGVLREKKELIPEAAFREVIANALVHRTWDVNSHINVSMFNDRIEVTSPGGLPNGITKEEYLIGGISIPRNYIIGNVFLRLKMIERFGTGIRRIKDLYSHNGVKPQFFVSDNMIKVVLPVLSTSIDLSTDYNKIYKLLRNQSLASSEIIKATGFGKNKTVSILNDLVEKGFIEKIGNGRGTKYRIL